MKFPILLSAAGVAALGLSSCGRGNDAATTINVAGSDTMLQVGLSWADAFKKVDPDVAVSIAGEGSSTGFKALIDSTAEIAHSSRAIKDSEAEKIKASRGADAVEHIVGWDGIAVYVHKDNPVKSLSLGQLKEIWAEGGTIANWSEVGGADAEIKRFGRSNSSGTYGFFQKAVLGPGTEFKPDTAASPGSSAVVESCVTTPSAIGYSGMSYKTEHVGWLSVSAEDGGEAVEPSIENVKEKKYPIARPLYIYTVGEPTGKAKEYLDWIKSDAGQKVVAEQGFVPFK
ncbi:MAG: PstS family phosphate ABC transporter substrate-binding protein [Verrucomicrobiales bacterium]